MGAPGTVHRGPVQRPWAFTARLPPPLRPRVCCILRLFGHSAGPAPNYVPVCVPTAERAAGGQPAQAPNGHPRRRLQGTQEHAAGHCAPHRHGPAQVGGGPLHPQPVPTVARASHSGTRGMRDALVFHNHAGVLFAPFLHRTPRLCPRPARRQRIGSCRSVTSVWHGHACRSAIGPLPFPSHCEPAPHPRPSSCRIPAPSPSWPLATRAPAWPPPPPAPRALAPAVGWCRRPSPASCSCRAGRPRRRPRSTSTPSTRRCAARRQQLQEGRRRHAVRGAPLPSPRTQRAPKRDQARVGGGSHPHVGASTRQCAAWPQLDRRLSEGRPPRLLLSDPLSFSLSRNLVVVVASLTSTGASSGVLVRTRVCRRRRWGGRRGRFPFPLGGRCSTACSSSGRPTRRTCSRRSSWRWRWRGPTRRCARVRVGLGLGRRRCQQQGAAGEVDAGGALLRRAAAEPSALH